MKIRHLVLISALFSSLFTTSVVAEPKNGFSLNAGLANHTRSCGGCPGSSTSGLSLGMDYQFALSNNFSLSPFLMSSSETNKNVPGSTVGHGILGAQLRYWVGDMFFGGHLGNYSEVILSGGTTVLSGSGVGTGLVAGWEQPDGGLYVMGQVDSATVTYSNVATADIPLSAFRLSVGYRWK